MFFSSKYPTNIIACKWNWSILLSYPCLFPYTSPSFSLYVCRLLKAILTLNSHHHSCHLTNFSLSFLPASRALPSPMPAYISLPTHTLSISHTPKGLFFARIAWLFVQWFTNTGDIFFAGVVYFSITTTFLKLKVRFILLYEGFIIAMDVTSCIMFFSWCRGSTPKTHCTQYCGPQYLQLPQNTLPDLPVCPPCNT